MGRSWYKYLPVNMMCSDAENCNADPLALDNVEMAEKIYKDHPDYPDAQGFPYTETRWKPDQAATKDVEGAPGKAFSLDAKSKEHHVVRAYSSGINLTGVDLMNYWSLANVVNAKRNCRIFAENECKDDNQNNGQNDDVDYNYHAARDDNPTHMWEMNLDQNGNASFIVKDGDGHVIVSGTLEKTGNTGKDQIIYQLATRSVKELDSRGNVIKSHPPMSCSYAEFSSQQNCVDASTYEYDSQSRIIKSSEPDAGITVTYYDLLGRVRATQTQNQITAKKASVMLYDHLDRVIAVGEWKHNKEENVLRTALLSDETVDANKTNFPKEEDLTPGTITRTFYDKMPTSDTLEFLGVDIAPSGVSFENTRGRVTAVISDVRAVFNTDGSAMKATSGADSVIRVSTASSYDKYGRILANFSFDPNMPADSLKMLAVENRYDLGGKLISVTKYPYGLSDYGRARSVNENYVYDNQGRVTIINSKNGEASSAEIAHYEYYPTGALKKVELGHSIVLSYTYHISGAVKNVEITSADGSKLYSETLYYEDCGGNGCKPQYNGNISRMAHEMTLSNSGAQGSRDALYVYDQLNRLMQVDDKIQNEFDEFFTYDAQGRITAQRRGDKAKEGISGGEYTYKNKTNMLKSVAIGMGGTADARKMSDQNNFMYDSEGKLTFDNSKKLQISYDWRGMPIEFTQTAKPDGSSDNKLYKLVMDYDGSGRRISKTIMYKNDGASDWEISQITHYTDIGSEIRENFAGAAPETKVVVNLPNGFGRYAIEDASERDNNGISGEAMAGYIPNAKFEWYLKNNLGSTILVYGTEGNATSESHPVGNPLAAYDYRAFGEQVELLPPSTGKVTENFTGKELDDEIALNYFGARYLDPMLGMWISVDAKRQYYNPYVYAGNNPVMRIDPDGNYDQRQLLASIQQMVFGMFMHSYVKPQLEKANEFAWNGVLTTLQAEGTILGIGATVGAIAVPTAAAMGLIAGSAGLTRAIFLTSLAYNAFDAGMNYGVEGVVTSVSIDLVFFGMSKLLPGSAKSVFIQGASNYVVHEIANDVLSLEPAPRLEVDYSSPTASSSTAPIDWEEE
jgi:RHS repeat-associated protein